MESGNETRDIPGEGQGEGDAGCQEDGNGACQKEGNAACQEDGNGACQGDGYAVCQKDENAACREDKCGDFQEDGNGAYQEDEDVVCQEDRYADFQEVGNAACQEDGYAGCQEDRYAGCQEDGDADCKAYGNADCQEDGDADCQANGNTAYQEDGNVTCQENRYAGYQEDECAAHQEEEFAACKEDGGAACLEDRYEACQQEECRKDASVAHREDDIVGAEENSQVTRRKRRKPLVNWKRLPWRQETHKTQPMPDHVTESNLSTTQEGVMRIPVSNRGEGAEWRDGEIDGEEIQDIERKLKEQETKTEEFYYTKEKRDREMESVIESTERVHDTLMSLRASKRKLEAERDELEAELYATSMEVQNVEVKVHTDIAGYEELMERFDVLKTTIEAQKETCPASFSLLLQLEEELQEDLDLSISDDLSHTEISSFPVSEEVDDT